MLGDAGFANCDKVLAPYKAVRYHLQEWKKCKNRPRNKEELFNYRHAQLRNVIERIFGVIKNRFKQLKLARPFKVRAQIRLVGALCCVHNILIYFGEIDEDEGIDDQDAPEPEPAEPPQGEGYRISKAETRRAGIRRDRIAEAMWRQYQAVGVLRRAAGLR